MRDESLVSSLSRCTGETVTIFTASGGLSGCGFTGILLSTSCDFVSLLTDRGSTPSNPISTTICPDCNKSRTAARFAVGSICDIPICAITSFCHNAI